MIAPPPASAASAPPAPALPRPATWRARGARPALALALALAAAIGAGCGGGGDAAPGPAAAPAPSAEAEWVRSVMTDLYLYADRVPKADLSGAQTASQALEALRVNPPDRFSYVDRLDRYQAFFDEGRSVGLGITYKVDGTSLVLRLVQPLAPAGAAGLQRGDRIVAVGGVDVATLVSAGTLADAFGATEAGVVVRLTLERDGARFERTITKADYAVSPVLATRTFDDPGGKVGYLVLYTFTEPTRQAWADAIAQLRAAGARRLIVDLRENGGGRLYVAAAVAASIAPSAAIGQTFTELRHNARHAADDLRISLPASPTAGSFDRVAWLVSESTCSASESLIAGLRPFRDDALVGVATCGKPVGFEPQTRDDVVLSAVSFVGRNRDGLTDWFDGLPPTCAVPAEPYRPFGDPADPRIAEALVRLRTGACSPAATAAAKAAPAPSAGRATGPGLSTETGLW